MRTLKRTTNLVKKVYEGLGNYLSPANFSYLWSLGSMALFCLVLLKKRTNFLVKILQKRSIVLLLFLLIFFEISFFKKNLLLNFPVTVRAGLSNTKKQLSFFSKNKNSVKKYIKVDEKDNDTLVETSLKSKDIEDVRIC